MFRSTYNFDKLLEKATSGVRVETDWEKIIQICDLIRQGDVQPKYAVGAMKKQLYSVNRRSAVLGLVVLDSCMKNCGYLIHDEVGTKPYMEQLRELAKTTSHDEVKAKILELIQAWAYAFRNSPKYKAVQDTLNIMKREGYNFPTLRESDAMFSADTAPAWVDGDVCHRCRIQFGMVQRKHHCRACGQVFCGQCSSKTAALPKFGIEKEVRVCERCFDIINRPATTKPNPENSDLPPECSVLSQQSQKMEPWGAVVLQMMKLLQGNGDTSSVRQMIQEEIRRSQNVENSEMLRQILASLEHKHAAELQEATLETEKYKLEAEFFKKRLEEVSREKKSVEKTEKMKELASHLAGLSIQQKQTGPSQQYRKYNKHSSGTTQGSYNGGTLPWLDPVKGNSKPFHRGGGNHGKFQNRNNYTNIPPNQNFMQNPNTNIQQPPLLQQPPILQQPPLLQQPPFLQYSPHFFQSPHFQESSRTEQKSEFQEKQNFQQARGGQTQRGYRGGQRGRGKGRSYSVGRDKKRSEAQTNDLSCNTPAPSTFQIQVTKVGGQWTSVDNLSCTSDASSYRGGNHRGRGRGRGRGAGHSNFQQGETGGQQATVKKNRRKNVQNEHGGQQKQHNARSKQNDEGDPEENCVIS